ncbi:MAG: hypothetical protein K2R93_19135 [Gemmatimonadaceae bacterium]|nr:hypothetical protein [Gemmatimonadaceae bacterium]
MTRTLRVVALTLGAVALAACGSLLTTVDGSGAHYGLLRGTVTRASGGPVANAAVGVSCVGTTNEPFGLTVDADATGKFQTNVNAPSIFPPLSGPSYTCRVLTPYTGVPLAEKSITILVSTSANARPVTEVSLVVP